MLYELIYYSAVAVLVFYLFLVIILHIRKRLQRSQTFRVAFFHPFCNDGGGGEKVLWCMIYALLQHTSHSIAIYSLESDKPTILAKTKSRFNIDLEPYHNQIQIIHIPGRHLLLPTHTLTMLFHILLPIIYSLKCLWTYQPDIFYDTTGFASTMIIVKWFLPTCKTFAYVHYPFISEDMINKIRQRKTDFNNDPSISQSIVKTLLKLAYYRIMLFLYACNGYFVDFAQTNSTWTHAHMSKIWTNIDKRGKLVKLYPPCTVGPLLELEKAINNETVHLMSLAQFRPEKNQFMQINIIKRVIDKIKSEQKIVNSLKSKSNLKIKLHICGTTRGGEDEVLLSTLRQYVLVHSLEVSLPLFRAASSSLETSPIRVSENC